MPNRSRRNSPPARFSSFLVGRSRYGHRSESGSTSHHRRRYGSSSSHRYRCGCRSSTGGGASPFHRRRRYGVRSNSKAVQEEARGSRSLSRGSTRRSLPKAAETRWCPGGPSSAYGYRPRFGKPKEEARRRRGRSNRRRRSIPKAPSKRQSQSCSPWVPSGLVSGCARSPHERTSNRRARACPPRAYSPHQHYSTHRQIAERPTGSCSRRRRRQGP